MRMRGLACFYRRSYKVRERTDMKSLCRRPAVDAVDVEAAPAIYRRFFWCSFSIFTAISLSMSIQFGIWCGGGSRS
jgi:hypothetical protein